MKKKTALIHAPFSFGHNQRTPKCDRPDTKRGFLGDELISRCCAVGFSLVEGSNVEGLNKSPPNRSIKVHIKTRGLEFFKDSGFTNRNFSGLTQKKNPQKTPFPCFWTHPQKSDASASRQKLAGLLPRPSGMGPTKGSSAPEPPHEVVLRFLEAWSGVLRFGR